MPTLTDPARELAEICTSLQAQSGHEGDVFVGSKLEVEPWSKEFFQILFCITERIDFLIEIVSDLDIDDDFRGEAVGHIRGVKNAFSKAAMKGAWKTSGAPHLAPHNVQPIKMLSPLVRERIQYPKLSDEERDELLSEIATLRIWLESHQLQEQDFIRQTLIDGLRQLHFRVSRVKWLGWGYTLESLREVIAAYMALERGIPDEGIDPTAEAVLKKVSGFVKSFYEKTQVAKGMVETGDFMLRAYGALCLLSQGSVVAGYLPSPTG